MPNKPIGIITRAFKALKDFILALFWPPLLEPPREEKATRLRVHITHPVTKEYEGMAEQLIDFEQQIRANLNPVSASGQPAKLDGPVEWTIENPDLLSIEYRDPENLGVIIRPKGVPGSTVVRARADADRDAGEQRYLIADLLVVVREPEAAHIAIVVGNVEPLTPEPASEEAAEEEPAAPAPTEPAAPAPSDTDAAGNTADDAEGTEADDKASEE